MTKRILILVLGLVVAMAAPVHAQDWVNNAIAVTDTSQMITFANCLDTLWIKNTGTANEVFVCPWRNVETVAACTATIGRRLDPGDAKSWSTGAKPGRCWKAVSLIASTGETSTAIGDSLQ